ncbi:superoxide dismutase [Xylariomycetidae sp. FL0641]|nr:superoxide dismutase [Xylariomycetidae sp. FL0641]
MRTSGLLTIAAIGASSALAQNVTTGKLGNALVTKNNPIGRVAEATLPEEPFFTEGSLNGNVKGSVKAKSGANGVGVDYEVTFSNIPVGESLSYHIHVAPVPEDGNCTSTLAHLDPFLRGEDPTCDSSKPETCQVGDLSGKHGKVTSDPFTATYHDDFASLADGVGSYFANRSFVLHFANKTRISCANFQITTPGIASNGSYTPTPTGSSKGGASTPSASSTDSPVPIGAAPKVLAAVKGLAVAPLMALLLAL